MAFLLTGCRKETPKETTAAATTAAVTETTAEASTEAPKKEPEKLFTFTRENMPVMDGSTSMVPLAKAAASVLLGESAEEVGDLVSFNRTTQSFRNLMYGDAEILIVGEPNAAVFDEMETYGYKYELEEIATDALIFVVNKDNPVENLTTEQIRKIYTGEITNWKEVGGNDCEIIPFQRNEGAGSQALIKKLIMKDTPMMEAPAQFISGEMGA
ncbi:MAG: substrate-binding domain-containing protein, partial [Eubacteriales bacterium]|nr:substrate-binding domain-containing protein [Eubacteriales bacterium]